MSNNLIEELKKLIEKYSGENSRWILNLHKDDLESVHFKGFVADKEIGKPLGLSAIGKPELNPDEWVGVYRKV